MVVRRGIEPALLAQFHPLEGALAAMGLAVWPMIELKADEGLASAAIAGPLPQGTGRRTSGLFELMRNEASRGH